VILVVGGRGNMGRRYRAILDYLERPYQIVEQEHQPGYVRRMAQQAEGIIIATPTSTHVELIRKFIPYGKPILCEKPLCRDLKELKELFREINESDAFLSMVLQYKVLAPKRVARDARPTSMYDYFRHGSDGLIWDCIQIIGLAQGAVVLSEESPIWKCTINGKKLDLGQMDMAYVKFIEGWLRDPGDDLGEVLAMHEKTWEAEQCLPTGRGH
jgi:hypothetical protein